MFRLNVRLILTVVASLVASRGVIADAPDYTKSPPAKVDKPYNLGPTGARGVIHVEGGMTFKSRQIFVSAVEKGSPADGVLEVGDVITGVFGQPFQEDARKSFGGAIGRAESEQAKGVLPVTVWRKGKARALELKLDVLGSYSETSPYACSKADAIFERGCALIAKDVRRENRFWINELALLASGKPEYLEIVRKSAHDLANRTPETEKLWASSTNGGMLTWVFGYNNLFLTEYYLATGDKTALPAIRSLTVCIARGQGFYGTWGHGLIGAGPDGKLHRPVPPYGPVNQAGLPCFLSLILAEKCGIDDPELKPAIARATKFFAYYSGKGLIPYGEHRPGVGHDDNGRTSLAALAFSLQGKHAEAKFFAKMVTASYESREYGHTGNAFSYVWGPSGANCGGPKAAAAFMKELRWYYDLARRRDGSFVFTEIGGGPATHYHGVFNATGSFVLGYGLAKKSLAITGKYGDPGVWLNQTDVDEAIAAERFVDDPHAKRSVERLLTGLKSWSPAERSRSAQELTRRKDDVVPQLLAMVKNGPVEARLGAIATLGDLKRRATPALKTLAELLQDDDRWIRVQAAEALRSIGADAKPVLPEMLKAAAASDEADLMKFTTGALAYALFYPGGASGPRGILAGSIKEVDKDLLYPAIKAVAVNPDSAARGCLRSTYGLLTLDDVQALAPTFIGSVQEMAPANTMFAKGIRLAGIHAMARLRIEEGLPLTMKLLKENEWGRNYVILESLAVLREYRGAAKPLLPELRALEPELKRLPEQHKKLLEVISLIEADANPPRLVSLKEYLGPSKSPKNR